MQAVSQEERRIDSLQLVCIMSAVQRGTDLGMSGNCGFVCRRKTCPGFALPLVRFKLARNRILSSERPVMGDGPDGLIVSQARHQSAKYDLENGSFRLDRGVGSLIENAPHVAVTRLCRLIRIMLHQGVRYEERGPSVNTKSRRQRTTRMIRELRSLGYRVEPVGTAA
jgi:hypothetical protein